MSSAYFENSPLYIGITLYSKLRQLCQRKSIKSYKNKSKITLWKEALYSVSEYITVYEVSLYWNFYLHCAMQIFAVTFMTNFIIKHKVENI